MDDVILSDMADALVIERAAQVTDHGAPRFPLVVDPGNVPHDTVYPSVADLLAVPQLEGIKLLSCHAAANLRRIHRTSVQELPLDDFVRPGELVMTTGIGLDEPRKLTSFVQDVARAGAAALAIAVGPYVKAIPPNTILEAERLGLPVFEFPWEVRFGDVTELVLAHVVERQHSWLRRSDKIHELFTRIVLAGGDLPLLCRFMEQQLHRPVRIVDRWGESKDAGSTSLAQAAPDGWMDAAVRAPITAERRPLGTLLVGSDDSRLPELDAMVAAHGATAAALILLLERAASEGEARGQSELLVAVLNGTTGSPRDLERRAIALGFDPRSAFAVLHLRFASPSGTEGEMADVARWSVQRALSGRHITALHAWDGSDVTLMIPDGAGRVPEGVIRGLISDIATLARRQSTGTAVTCGIGRTAPNLAEVQGSFREAVTACRLGETLGGPGSTTDYRDLGPYPALYEALNSDRTGSAFQELQERYLGTVSRYEEETGLPLLETLAVLFAERGNVSATARTLRINRQSLLYRLERFEALSGIDLDSAVDRFGLELAVRCRRMQSGRLDGSPALRNGHG
jgi:PucR family transcriptional regulator, purine catabolism regulatory protein